MHRVTSPPKTLLICLETLHAKVESLKKEGVSVPSEIINKIEYLDGITSGACYLHKYKDYISDIFRDIHLDVEVLKRKLELLTNSCKSEARGDK